MYICERDEQQMSPDNAFFFSPVCENNGQDMVLVINEAHFDLFCLVYKVTTG